MKKAFLIISSLLFLGCSQPTTTINKSTEILKTEENLKPEKVNWVDFNSVFKKAKEEKKYVMVSFYVDWCQYCKKLNTEVYFDDKLSKYLNEKFVSVKVNAESEEEIIFKDKKIAKKNLAKVFGVNGYPNIFFLENEDTFLAKIPLLLEIKDFYISASYIGNNAYKTISLEEHKERVEILEY